MAWIGKILYRNNYPFPLTPTSLCWYNVSEHEKIQKRAFKMYLKEFEESSTEIFTLGGESQLNVNVHTR